MRYQAALLPELMHTMHRTFTDHRRKNGSHPSRKGLDTYSYFFYTHLEMEKPLEKKPRRPKDGTNFLFYVRPIDQALIDFLQAKNTLSVSNVIRMALAYHAEALGLNIAKLMEAKKDHESTPA